MITRKLFSTACLAAFAMVSLCLPKVSAQSPSSAAQNGQNAEPLQVVVDYGQGQPKRRVSHDGIISPVGLPIAEPASITLQFLRKRAGEAVVICPLDGGQVDVQAPVTISADGTIVFNFQSGSSPGLYRLMVSGPADYQLSLYAFDPNRPRRPPPGPANQ
jgi:hypothetical protein